MTVPTASDPAHAPPSREGGARVLELLRVMHRLRGPGGCPWDREQTHESLGRHLLEEAHETLEAIESGDPDRLRDELGDVLLQVVFHAEMAMQEGRFDIDEVAAGIIDKLVRRHPHVFGDVQADTSAEVLVNWERIKASEGRRGGRGLDDAIPRTLPALARASKVQRRAAGFGFDWRSSAGAAAKVREELAELEAAGPDAVEGETGDLLFAVAALARALGVDPETALRKATRRFSERFEAMRSDAERQGTDLSSLTDEELVARFRAARG